MLTEFENNGLTYRLDLYEGPLDLLLTLIAKNKMDIRDIPIAEICTQYMQYINEAQRMNLDVAGEFIVMASELMLIKSRMLLPVEEEEEQDPRHELVDALLLYQKAKQDADELLPLYKEFSGRIAKEEDEIPPEKGYPLGLDPALLSRALHIMLNRLNAEEKAPVTLINPLIKTRVVSVEKCISRLVTVLEKDQESSLFHLLKDATDKPELVATFMGLLELIKLRRVLICDPAEDAPQNDGLTISFKLNPNADDIEQTESEFDNDEPNQQRGAAAGSDS